MDDVRYVCGSALTKALIRWLLDNYANLKTRGQFTIDHDPDSFVAKHLDVYERVKISS